MDAKGELKKRLAAVLHGEVENDAQTLTKYSRDASLFEIRPRLIAYPKDAADLANLVSFVEEHPELKVNLTARSAGTDMSGGALTDSVVVDMTRHFNRILRIGHDEAVTQPGVFYRDFEKATLKHHLLLPSYPASREICTVGGMAANNSGGEKSLRFGKTANFVKRLKMILRDGREHVIEPIGKAELETKMKHQGFEGEMYRGLFKLVTENAAVIKKARPKVSKNSAGYDLWDVWDGKTFDPTRLFVGSQGTLGFITEITYRLVTPEPHEKLLVIFLRDLKPLPDLVNAILKHDPESFESYDDYTLKFALKYHTDIMKFMGAKNIVSLGMQFLPEFGMFLRGGFRFPKMVLLAEFTGKTEKELDGKISAAQADLAPFRLNSRVTRTEQEAKKYWVIRRESFNLLRRHFKESQTAPFIDDFCVLPKDLPSFLPKLYALLEPYHLTLTIVGHVGDGNFHVIPIMKLSDPKTPGIIEELSKKVYDLVLSYGGSITGEHNDGLIRSPFLREMYGDKMYALFKQVKTLFDPHDIFNPRKKVGASLAYALDHLKKS